MIDELKPCLLADVEWLHLGSTNEYKDVKKFIADICYDVARAACIDEICINDICVGFRQCGYEVIAKCDLDALRAELAAARAEAEKYRPIPVSERMPKYFDEVLFYDNIADTWTMGYLNKGQWTAIDMLYWHGKDFKRITHWMPLPPAPEVEP